VHLARCQAWRARHPGYWRKASHRQTASKDVFPAQVLDPVGKTGIFAHTPLQDPPLYVGGMGAKDENFHKELVSRVGSEAAANEIQDHYLAGGRKEAAAAVLDQLAATLT
jgi:hypothetical protein